VRHDRGGGGAQRADAWTTGNAERIRVRTWCTGWGGAIWRRGTAWHRLRGGARSARQRTRDAPGAGALLWNAQHRFHFGIGLFDQNKLHIFEPNLKNLRIQKL
jgi:hypothetical protein